MSKTNYKRLGDYIREVDIRNRDLKVKLSQGISNEKYFQQPKQVAINPYNDKIVRKGQFAFNRATTRNGNKISIAYREAEDCTVSASYCVFDVKNEDILSPKYLMMWFKRPEFDRYAIYHSHGSAHEYFTFENMCEVELPIPPIDQQRKIVAEYNAIQRRIKLNEQQIVKLEETAQAIYRKMFVDGIDKNNLLEGWKLGTIKDFCKEITSGGTPSRTHNEYWNSKDYRWLKTGEVQNNIVLDTEEYISVDGLRHSSAKIIPCCSVTMAMYGATASQVAYLECETSTNQACCNMICNNKMDAAYLYFHLLLSGKP